MNFVDLLQWWNLIFLLPFGLALVYVLLMATGAVVAEGGHDFGLDHDQDVGLDHDIDHDAHMDAHAPEGPGFVGHMLTLLGVGRVPLSLIATCFCFVWGFSGWASNEVFRSFMPAPALYVWISIAIALFMSLLFTRFLVFGMTKILPLDENYAVSDVQLVGRRAKVRFTITPVSGTAQLNDQYGTLHEVPCRLKSDEQEIKSLPPGTPIILLDYDREKKVFYVRHDPLENTLENSDNKRALP
jgi:hypothetical protein